MAIDVTVLRVFTDEDGNFGNPLGVVDASQAAPAERQRIAAQLGYSETIFIDVPNPGSTTAHARIYTPATELPFAGHPTLGSAHAWLAGGGKPKRSDVVVQECGAGLVSVRRDAGRLSFAAPPLIRGGQPTEQEIAEVVDVLQIDRAAIVDATWADNGPGWIAVMLESADAVLAVEPRRFRTSPIDIGIVGPRAPGGETAFELRAIFYDLQGSLVEDPVTGSLNASVGQWLFATGRASNPYVAAQGTRLGRTGRVYVEQDSAGQVWVGGATRTVFSGQSEG